MACVVRLLAAVAGFAISVGTAEAQSGAGANPARGLYGGRRPAVDGQALDLTVAVFGTYSEQVEATEAGVTAPPVIGWAGTAFAAARYRAEGRRVQAEAGGASLWLQPLERQKGALQQYSAEAVVAANMWPGAFGRLVQTLVRAPYYELSVVPVAVPETLLDPTRLAGDFATADVRTWLYSGAAELRQNLGPIVLIGEHARRRTKVEGRGRYERQRSVGGVALNLSRHVSLRGSLGEEWQDSRSAAARPRERLRILSVGLDFSKPLSLTRRMTMNVASGSSAAEWDGARRYVMTGAVSLTREIGRTWRASLRVDREFDFLDGVEQPVLVTRAGLGLGGFVGRRINVQGGAGASVGELRTGGEGSSFDAYLATLRVGVAAARQLTVTAEGTWNRQEFDRAFGAVGARGDDVRLRVGATIWLPIVGRN